LISAIKNQTPTAKNERPLNTTQTVAQTNEESILQNNSSDIKIKEQEAPKLQAKEEDLQHETKSVSKTNIEKHQTSLGKKGTCCYRNNASEQKCHWSC